MKNHKNPIKEYESPQIEVIIVEIEAGFQSSNMENLEQGEEIPW